MIYAFDTYYTDDHARTVCIGFQDWADATHSVCTSETIQIDTVDGEYVSGAFYKRELPCILGLLSQITLKPGDLIVVDGYVVLDEAGKYGLGGHLYEHLGRRYPVVGVAKNNYVSLEKLKTAVLRGESQKPLYVTALGIDIDEASACVGRMHGEYRIPTLLKSLDQMSRTA